MQIVNLKNPEMPFSLSGGCGLCLGHFDGVHRGHRALINELKLLNTKRKTPLPLGAMCFTAPPAATLMKKPTPQITTLPQKLELLKKAGLHFAVLYDFPEIKDYSPERFIDEILVRDCNCRMVVCGFNYSFGAKGAGSPADLQAYFVDRGEGRALSVVPPVKDGVRTVSSTLIRSLLESGHPDDANRLMGHPFTLIGTVKNGRRVGRMMDTPTANLTFPEGILIPAHGVYVSTVRIGKNTYPAISNVGTRPTFEDGEEVNCETFLFDFHGDLYEKTLHVTFLKFLRPERKFPSMEALKKQIEQDIRQAKAYTTTLFCDSVANKPEQW